MVFLCLCVVVYQAVDDYKQSHLVGRGTVTGKKYVPERVQTHSHDDDDMFSSRHTHVIPERWVLDLQVDTEDGQVGCERDVGPEFYKKVELGQMVSVRGRMVKEMDQ